MIHQTSQSEPIKIKFSKNLEIFIKFFHQRNENKIRFDINNKTFEVNKIDCSNDKSINEFDRISNINAFSFKFNLISF